MLELVGGPTSLWPQHYPFRTMKSQVLCFAPLWRWENQSVGRVLRSWRVHNSQAELTKVTGPDRYEAVSGAPGQCQFWSSERSEVHGH